MDWLVEPLFHDRGYYWYKNDYVLSWTNVFHLAFTTVDDDEALLAEVTSLYSDFVREPIPPLLEKIRHRYREIADEGPPNVGRFMDYVAERADEFQRRYPLDDVKTRRTFMSLAWFHLSIGGGVNTVKTLTSSTTSLPISLNGRIFGT